ncbi:hypothetical protein D3C78_1412380 [compost metagenome]
MASGPLHIPGLDVLIAPLLQLVCRMDILKQTIKRNAHIPYIGRLLQCIPKSPQWRHDDLLCRKHNIEFTLSAFAYHRRYIVIIV